MSHFVQSCITNVSFPETMENLYGMAAKNGNSSKIIGDLDMLLNFSPESDICWTAPKWLTAGDILFFYHAVTAKKRIASLLKQAKICRDNDVVKFLEHSKQLADQYSGKIFGYAIVAEQPIYFDDNENESWHFKGRIFAPLKEVHIFDNPLDAKDLSDFLLISRQSSITYIVKEQFNNLRKLLSEYNYLSEYIINADFTEIGLKNITKNNWTSIACAENTRFSLEIQLRAYFVDYFLNQLKDEGSALLEECNCIKKINSKNSVRTGFSDYFIRLHDKWIPVEAKLNIKAERNLFSQIEKYIHINSFIPVKGNNARKEFFISNNPFCIIVDQFGMYITFENTFYQCSADNPILKRIDINNDSITNVRAILKKYFNNYNEQRNS